VRLLEANDARSDKVTRFKELRRIEAAIKDKDQRSLAWALSYCEMRIKIANRKDHEKHWRGLKSRVEKAISTSD
jgi:hypothetical protein